MNDDDRHNPRLDPHHDARLSELIHDAAQGVEPGEGLSVIRSRTDSTVGSTTGTTTGTKESTMSTSRNWLYAVGGAVVGTAAVIVAIAVVSQAGGDDSTPVAGSSSSQTSPPTEQSSPSESATDTPSSATTSPATPVEGAVPVYYAGDGPAGTVLFREFHPGIGGDPVAQAASATVTGPPLDPDYRTLWPAGTQATATYDGDVITVDLTGADLHDRPAGMSKRDAGLALQQVVYSVQGAAGERAGVQLLLDGQHSDTVLGEPSSEPLTNAPVLETLSLMSITTPEEGQSVSGSFPATGVNNGFEASMSYEIRNGAGKVVGSGAGMATGWGEDKLFPWEVDVDVSGLAPGTYTFVAMNDDPTGGAEGHGPATDSRTIVVQ